jgi:DNA-binding GntR family transcriptional regulator
MSSVVESPDAGLGLGSVATASGKTVQERVYRVLRDAIFDGSINPDEKIRQSEIAHVLGVSVTPVREALRDLAAEGLVSFDPHRGAAVRSFAFEEYEEVIEIRLALEPIRCRRLLRHITDAQMAELVRLHEAIVLDPGRYLELNQDFHDVLAAASQAPMTSGFINTLSNISFVMLSRTVHTFPHRILEGISEHARIIEAIRERDEERLIEVILHHSRATWDLAREQMEAAGQAPSEA